MHNPILSVDGLSVFYGQSRILFDVSLKVAPGQVVSLMGRNGVGKTTLLKSLMGLLPAKEGRVAFDDRDITARPPHERARAGIGYVPQGRSIFPYLTLEGNLLLGLEAVDSTMRTPAALQAIYEQFPALHTYRKKVAGTLSGGQQQQLALGRVLIRKPSLLLLDEPTEGIQPSVVQEIEELILGLRERREMAVLLVEQFLDFAMGVSDYCYVMEKGAIVAEGAAGELQQDAVREYLAL